ncbi:SIS domain-containing protein [Ottowia sp.]|jgi:D-sedoheptulose 7-phosphate isomerase|uniref:SIS domain-containing protein n=1 Tax=Ottowia sp. TaxID=1898956 RepID=UPI0025D9E85F|nr:SIS domain-containing protein [Ottowia sp.]MBK6615266.1 SIS domain-containing protein [Ottowia sp.]
MLEHRIQQQFIDSADLKYQWAQALARPIAEATQALLACVTGGGKVLVCGNGASGALAQYVAALLVGGLDRPRPELPALALGTDAATLTAVARRGEYADAFAAQIRALGSAGDTLLVLSANGQAANLVRAVQAAHEREMSVIALTGSGGGEVGRLLRDTDVHVCVPHESTPRIHEAHQLVLHCLCDGLDQQLLGDEENSA